MRYWLRARLRNRREFLAFSLAFNILAVGLIVQLGVSRLGSPLDLYYKSPPNEKMLLPEAVGLRVDSFDIQTDGWPAFFSYKPNGNSPRRVDKRCWPEDLSRQIYMAGADVGRQAGFIRDYFERCQQQLFHGRERGIRPIVDYMNLHYPIADNQAIRPITFRLPDERVLTGLLALQETHEPRPLVIVKCGMFCNAAESSNPANAFMHLFDESPFHVLVLSNIASQDFEMLNGGIAIGGFDEGAHIYEVARWFRAQETVRDRKVSSVHVMGFSLGSHGALYSGLYSSLNKPVIDSVIAICPVVHLERSVSRLFEGMISGRVAGFMATQQMRGATDPDDENNLRNDDLFKQWLPDPRQLLDEVSYSVGRYYDRQTRAGWPLAPFKGAKVDSLRTFWSMNDYSQYAANVRVPTLLLPAEDDGIVLTDDNSRLLAGLGSESKVQVASLPAGEHCAHSIANGWSLTSGLLRNFILAHSPEIRYEKKEISVLSDLRWDRWPFSGDLHVNEQFYGSRWDFEEGRDYAEIHFDILQHSVPGCSFGVGKPEICFRRITAELDISEIEGLRIPESDDEARVLTRFANTRFRLLNVDKQDVRSGNKPPSVLSFYQVSAP